MTKRFRRRRSDREQQLVARFLEAPLSFARQHRRLSPSLFRAVADAVAARTITSPMDSEELVRGALDLAWSPCSQSRAHGLRATLSVFRQELAEALTDTDEALERAGSCPFCLGNAHKIRGHVALARGDRSVTEEELDRAGQLLKDRDRAGYANVLMVRARVVEADDRVLAFNLLMEAHQLTSHYEENGFLCPSRSSATRAASYHRDAGSNLAIVLGNARDDPTCLALAREKLPAVRRKYRRQDHLPRGTVWWLEGQLELDACIATGHCTEDGVWREGKTARRARDKVLSRYHHALRSLCDAGAPAELAALLADLGAVDRDALADVLLGDANVLRRRVDVVLATLPPEAAAHTTELRALFEGVPAPPPEIDGLRTALLATTRADVPAELPAVLVERIEDVQESAAVLLTELEEARPSTPEERFRRALEALRRSAESSGAPPPVVRLYGVAA